MLEVVTYGDFLAEEGVGLVVCFGGFDVQTDAGRWCSLDTEVVLRVSGANLASSWEYWLVVSWMLR